MTAENLKPGTPVRIHADATYMGRTADGHPMYRSGDEINVLDVEGAVDAWPIGPGQPRRTSYEWAVELPSDYLHLVDEGNPERSEVLAGVLAGHMPGSTVLRRRVERGDWETAPAPEPETATTPED